MPYVSPSVLRAGREAGRKFAAPHSKKPGFVFSIALVTIILGAWLNTVSAAGWILIGFGCIGMIRCYLLLQGKDFEPQPPQ